MGGAQRSERLDKASIAHLRARLERYMVEKGLRSTTQRRVVTDVFFRSGGHLSIEELLEKVRRQDPGVGYATVYRTLKLLTECGVASARDFGDGVSRYEVGHEDEHHDHLICTQCGRIVEFEDPRIEALQDDIARRHGFALTSHKHELYGVCPSCQRREGPPVVTPESGGTNAQRGSGSRR